MFADGYFSDRRTEMAKRNGRERCAASKRPGAEPTPTMRLESSSSREKPKVVALRSRRDVDRGIAVRPGDTCAAAHEAGVSGDRRIASPRSVACGWSSTGTGVDAGLQLHAKGIELAAGPVSRWRCRRERWNGCEPAPTPVAQLVSGSQADSRLLHGVAPLPSHCADFHVLRLARSACR